MDLNLNLNLNDPAVQAAVISAAGSIFTSFIAGLCALLVSIQVAGRRKLAEKLQTAQADIEFLLAVEQAHCDRHQAAGGQSFKITVRKQVKEQGCTWSGKFTPGRLAHPEFEKKHWTGLPA